jgi:hypothetical protein
MKQEFKKTSYFVGTAALLVLLAWATKPGTREAAPFTHQGEEFYPAFKDPLSVASLEVIDYDELGGVYKPFKVQVVNGQWSIPSHHNYPADGKDRLAKTAASVMDLRKEQIASENPKLHEEFGVVDPLDAAAQGTRGRGKRVRLFDKSGTVLADYIFGKEVKDRTDHRYVRVPDQKQTYAVKVQPDISVKFEDWVETDLLQLASVPIRKVAIDRYSVDIVQQVIKDRSTHFLAKEEGSSNWKVSGLKDTEEVNTDTISTLTSTLSGLKLTGVRKKPALVANVKDLSELSKVRPEALMMFAQSMGQHGFYLIPEENKRYSMVSSEGEMEVSCDDGVVYTLRFGEVLVGSGEEVTAGSDEKKDPKEKKDDKKAPGSGTENRYLVVSARYDDTLIGPPPTEPKPYAADPSKKPEEQKAEEEKAKKAKEEWEAKKKDLEKKKEDGKKRAEKLSARFADWYYVISADAFKKLRVERAQLVKPKAPPKDEKKPEEKPKEEKAPESKKLEEKKPEEKKSEAKPPGDKKPQDKPKASEDKKP